MKKRLYSATLLLLVLAGTIALDLSLGVAWFSAAVIIVVLGMGMLECDRLLRLRTQSRLPGAAPGLPGVICRGLLAVACIALPGTFLLALRLQEGGLFLLLYLIAVAKMVDNGALLAGRLWGRHKLAPRISPAKTIEGALGGILTGTASAVLLGPLWAGGGLRFFLLFGFTISLLAILGDLAESLLKRQAGVKDSGSLLPGIGGVLDLLDSILLSAPAGYLLLTL